MAVSLPTLYTLVAMFFLTSHTEPDLQQGRSNPSALSKACKPLCCPTTSYFHGPGSYLIFSSFVGTEITGCQESNPKPQQLYKRRFEPLSLIPGICRLDAVFPRGLPSHCTNAHTFFPLLLHRATSWESQK